MDANPITNANSNINANANINTSLLQYNVAIPVLLYRWANELTRYTELPSVMHAHVFFSQSHAKVWKAQEKKWKSWVIYLCL